MFVNNHKRNDNTQSGTYTGDVRYFASAAILLCLILLSSVTPVVATSHVIFEFLDATKNFQSQDRFVFGKDNELVVTSQQVDIRTLLPIEIVIRVVGDKTYKNLIPNDPNLYCVGPDRCSIPGPQIPDPGQDAAVVITATDKNGNLLAEEKFGKQPEVAEPGQTEPSGSEAAEEDGGINPWLIAGIALLALLALGGAVMLASSGGGCPDECTLNDCRECKIVKLDTTNTGWEPGEKEDLLGTFDLLWWLTWVPRTVSPAGKSSGRAALMGAKKLAEHFLEKAKDLNGVEVHATIGWEECQEKSCWLFWSHKTWVAKTSGPHKIPPSIYQYVLNSKAWDPKRLVDEKKREEIRGYIEREAFKHCPAACKKI